MSQLQTKEIELKLCEKCRVEKSPESFYEKEKDSQGIVLRRDSVCKDCRRSQRLERYKNQSNNQSYQPNRLIEPQVALEKGPKELIEPEKNKQIEPSQSIDYSLWERLYGRSLSELEKLEIKTNLTGFFTVLIEEAQRQGLSIVSTQGKGTGYEDNSKN